MELNFAAVLVFVLLALAFVIGSLLFGFLLRPKSAGGETRTIYECGEPTIGSPWVRFNSRFYTVALVYLLFDVEVVVLMPAMLVLRELAGAGLGVAALLALLPFVALLVLGLAYEWHYGNLDWIGQQKEADARDAAAQDAAQAELAARVLV